MDTTNINEEFSMSNKILILALAHAALAAGKALTEVAESLPDDSGVTFDVADTIPAAQVTPAQIANAELDAEGLPWDERIHAGTKTKTQKNVWTRKKGVQDNVFDAVVAELRQHYPAATPAAAAPVQATLPTLPGAIAVPQVSIPVASTPYTELVNFIAKNTGVGKALTEHWINDAFEKNNVTLASLAADLDRSKQFLDAFRGVLTGMNVAEVI